MNIEKISEQVLAQNKEIELFNDDDIYSIAQMILDEAQEPMSVGFHAVSRAEVTDLDVVMVIGCGMIGVGAVVRAALRGARVIAVDMDDEKLALAKRLGAHETINSKTENVSDKLKAFTNGYGPDVVIEAVGAPVTYQMAINEVAFTGRVVCIGYAKTEIAFETKYFVQKEMDIRVQL